MSIISGILFDLTSICRSRGGIAEDANFDPGIIEDSSEAEINKLNDLATLLEIKDELNAFMENVSENPLPGPVLAKIRTAFASATGPTAFEKYLNALEAVRNSDFFSGLSQGVKDQIDGLLEHLRAAKSTLQTWLSPSGMARLAVLEGQQQDLVGIELSLVSVITLIDQMQTELNLSEDQLNEAAINAQIAIRCALGVPIIAPPPPPPPPPPVALCSDGVDNDGDTKVDYPNDPSCTDANDNDEASSPQSWAEQMVYSFEIRPSYGILAYGDNDSALEAGPALHLSAALGYDISKEFSLQLDYRGFANVVNDFSSSRVGQDFWTISGIYGRYVFQGGFLWTRNVVGQDVDEYLGTAGFGARFLNDLIYPFLGGFAGNSDPYGLTGGGYIGTRFFYGWGKERELGWQTWREFEFSAQVLATFLDREEFIYRLGGSAEFAWDAYEFGSAPLQIGAAASAAYDGTTHDGTANVNLGLFLRWGRGAVVPQPILWGGY
jgi:hypothetical protein